MEAVLQDGGVERFFGHLDRTLALGPQASLAKPVAVRFALGEAGSWLLRASPSAPGSVVLENGAAPQQVDAACTVSCSQQTLLDLAGGRLKPAAAYLKGQIRVAGDRAVFMQLRSAIQAAGLELKHEVGARPSSAASVAVLGATVRAGANDRYAVYQLQVSEGERSWLLLRRWSEVRQLERQLTKLRPAAVAPPPKLPRSLDFAGSLEAAFLAKRCAEISRYVDGLLASYALSLADGEGPEPLLRFLADDGDDAEPALLGLDGRRASSSQQMTRPPTSMSSAAVDPLGAAAGGAAASYPGLASPPSARSAPPLVLMKSAFLASRLSTALASPGATSASAGGGGSGTGGGGRSASCSNPTRGSATASGALASPPPAACATSQATPSSQRTRRIPDVYPPPLDSFSRGQGGASSLAFDGDDDFAAAAAAAATAGGGAQQSQQHSQEAIFVARGSWADATASPWSAEPLPPTMMAEEEAADASRRSIGARDSPDGPPSVRVGEGVDAYSGLLLRRMQSEATSAPICAESDAVALGVRVRLLRRLRSLEAAQRRRDDAAAARRDGVLRLLKLVLLGAAAVGAAEHGLRWLCCGLLLLHVRCGARAPGGPLAAALLTCASLLAVGGAYGWALSCRADAASQLAADAAAAVEEAAAVATGAASWADEMATAAAAASDGEGGGEGGHAERLFAATDVAMEAATSKQEAATLHAVAAAAALAAADGAAAIDASAGALGVAAGGVRAAGGLAAGALLHAAAAVRAAAVAWRVGGAALLLCACVAFRLFGRIFRIYSIAFGAIGSYILARRLLEWAAKLGLSSAAEDRVWSWLHRRMARPVCAQLVGLRSVFVKFGQYVGGRADIVPPEWADALKQLQDDLPADSDRHTRRTVREAFGASIEQVFASFEMAPIASASVAQVHVATLRGTQQKVVLKLQHRGVASLMARDMVAAKRIAAFVRRFAPSFATLHTVLCAWEGEMVKELDFNVEASNLSEVAHNLRQARVEAAVPTPLPGLVARQALVMSFEEGFKVTDEESLALHGVDRHALMARIVNVYGQQLFVDGFFNADPHAGNLMVQVRPPRGGDGSPHHHHRGGGGGGGSVGGSVGGGGGLAVPVLLDFGMTVRLSHKQRLGYARLAHAAHQMDVAALQEAVRSLGVVNSQSEELPGRDLEFWRFFLRDTGGRAAMQTQAKAFFAERGKQRTSDKAAGRGDRRVADIPPDLIFFWRVVGRCAASARRSRSSSPIWSSSRSARASPSPPRRRRRSAPSRRRRRRSGCPRRRRSCTRGSARCWSSCARAAACAAACRRACAATASRSQRRPPASAASPTRALCSRRRRWRSSSSPTCSRCSRSTPSSRPTRRSATRRRSRSYGRSSAQSTAAPPRCATRSRTRCRCRRRRATCCSPPPPSPTSPPARPTSRTAPVAAPTAAPPRPPRPCRPRRPRRRGARWAARVCCRRSSRARRASATAGCSPGSCSARAAARRTPICCPSCWRPSRACGPAPSPQTSPTTPPSSRRASPPPSSASPPPWTRPPHPPRRPLRPPPRPRPPPPPPMPPPPPLPPPPRRRRRRRRPPSTRVRALRWRCATC